MDTIQLSSLDHYFAEYITRLEGARHDGLWLAAALVSAVSCRGDVCLDLATAAEYAVVPYEADSVRMRIPEVDAWCRLLASCSTVGSPGEYSPLVLDVAGRLYLHKYWDFERRVAEEILERSVPALSADALVGQVLERYFPTDGVEVDMQREAARAALSRRFAVISGGPGTGKTSTVARILALMVELSGGGECTVLLAAPTGKAAMRLKQSITQSLVRLELSEPVRTRIPLEVSTLHRLLGVVPGRADFRHNRANPLKCDAIVIDEASMIDLPLMARLLDAVPPDARMILLGDRDQLSSVEAGAVLADICAGVGSNSVADGNRPAIVPLVKSYRFSDQSGIGKLSRLVNAGDAIGSLELLTSGSCGDIGWRSLPSNAGFSEAFKVAVQLGFTGFMSEEEPAAALEELERFRVLTPHREGRYGAVALNRLAETALLQGGHDRTARFFFRPVMVTGNNYDLDLYNGDTGVRALSSASEIEGGTAYFKNSADELRRISALRLPAHESAYAMTVHKSQGSEFERVLVILPEQLSAVLCRELLYTAITRARVSLEIWGVEDVFCRAVERCVTRQSGLKERLWGRQ